MLFFGNTTLFAILYSIGVIVSLVGTGFLIGFARQLRSMFDPVRLWATVVMLLAFVMVWWVFAQLIALLARGLAF